MPTNFQLSIWGLAQAFGLIKFAEACFTDHPVTTWEIAFPFVVGAAALFAFGFIKGVLEHVSK